MLGVKSSFHKTNGLEQHSHADKPVVMHFTSSTKDYFARAEEETKI